LDGPHHFVQISNWEDPLIKQQTDIFKMNCANKHGYSIIRIYQEDIWKDNIDWKSHLINGIKSYNIISNILNYSNLSGRYLER